MTKPEKLCLIVAICLAAGVRLTSFDEGDAGGAASFDLMGFLTQIFDYGLLAYFCYFYRNVLWRYLQYLWIPIPLALLVLSSTMWSIVPSYSLRRGIAFVLVSLLAYCMGALLKPSELYQLYVRALRAMVILSGLVLVFLRQYGISHGAHSGAWRGAFYHKNRAGEIMALAFITLAFAEPMSLFRVRRLGIALAALLLLYKAQASTAVIAVAIVFAAQAVWGLLMLRRKALAGIVLAGYPIAVLAVALIATYAQSLFKLLGKDATFSGRDRLWAGVADAIRLRPLLGYGYSAFWLEQGQKLIIISEKTTFQTSHAHNGFLNLILHVGMIGLALFVFLAAVTLWVTIREGRRTRSVEARWFFSFLVFMAVANLTESQLLESTLTWITLVAFCTSFSIQRANRFDEIEVTEESPVTQSQCVLV